MKNLVLICSVTILLVCAVGVASAQMGMRHGPPAVSGLWHIVVGSGSLYEVESENGPNHTMEFDVIGKESVGGKEAAWIEFTRSAENATSAGMCVKELVIFDAAAMQMQLVKLIMQLPGRPPMEMSGTAMGMQEPIKFTDVHTYQDLGSESVTTPAGTFTCEHYKAKDGSGEAWVNEKVVPFGLVKSRGKSSTITLVKTITDAKDKIVGTPQPFDPMKMMQQGPPPQQ